MLVARVKLIFDLLLATAFYLNGEPLLYLLAPVLDIVLALASLRFMRRAPALLTFASLAFSAGLLALAPLVFGASGYALWVLFPLIPQGAGFVLGRRKFLLWMSLLVTGIIVAVGYPLLTSDRALSVEQVGFITLFSGLVITIWATAWLIGRTLQADPASSDILGEPLTVARNVVIVPLHRVIGGLQSEALRLELHDLKRRQNPRWIVLDLAPAGELGRRDLNAVDKAASAISTSHCTVVLARPPVDALGHLDFARPVVGRVERFASLPQAIEAGLRRLGWSEQPKEEQPSRVTTIF